GLLDRRRWWDRPPACAGRGRDDDEDDHEEERDAKEGRDREGGSRASHEGGADRHEEHDDDNDDGEDREDGRILPRAPRRGSLGKPGLLRRWRLGHASGWGVALDEGCGGVPVSLSVPSTWPEAVSGHPPRTQRGRPRRSVRSDPC